MHINNILMSEKDINSSNTRSLIVSGFSNTIAIISVVKKGRTGEGKKNHIPVMSITDSCKLMPAQIRANY